MTDINELREPVLAMNSLASVFRFAPNTRLSGVHST